MPELELHQLVFDAIEISNGAFEFWITITFAALVAGYYTFSGLTRGHQHIALILYGSVALVFIMRWFNATNIIFVYMTETAELGEVFPMTHLSTPAWVLQTFVMIFGSLATIAFLRTKGRVSES